MADTTFINTITLTDSDWFNDVNRLHYTIFNDPGTLSTARYTFLNGMDKITNALTSAINITTSTTYFDGPSIAQSTVGTWFAQGSVTLLDTTNAAIYNVKLWDGTTVIASGKQNATVSSAVTMALCSYLTTPAGNLRLSVNNLNSTNAKITFSTSGNILDSTITAIRIG